ARKPKLVRSRRFGGGWRSPGPACVRDRFSLEGLRMILVTYHTPDGLALGVKTGRSILDVAAACGRLGCTGLPHGVNEVLGLGTEALEPLRHLVGRAEAHPDLFRAESELRLG